MKKIKKPNKETLLLCAGASGSGKTYFINNVLSDFVPDGTFYRLKSATTRPMRDGEQEGVDYYFRDEKYFETEKLATRLFVNEKFWKPGTPKWLYGVPEFEIYDHMGQNLIYDVMQPKYLRQMINWFNGKHLNEKYDYRVLWFLPPINASDIVKNRENMPNDADVRRENTCLLQDFRDAEILPDHVVICNSRRVVLEPKLREFLHSMNQHIK